MKKLILLSLFNLSLLFSLKSQTLVYAIDCGNAVSSIGNFKADTLYATVGNELWAWGTVDMTPIPAAKRAPEDVYKTVRFNWNSQPVEYQLGDLTAGSKYNLRLHFSDASSTKAGQRKFDVYINGSLEEMGYDIYETAGVLNGCTILEYTGVVADANGKIKIELKATADNGAIAAIEVFFFFSGINEINSNPFGIQVYPSSLNSGEVTVLINNINDKTNLVVFDICGKIIYSQDVMSNQIKLNRSIFTEGIYFIQVKDTHNSSVKKIIVY